MVVHVAVGNRRFFEEVIEVVRQPQSWCDPAGASPAQVKGSVLLGSECCVAAGDSGCEAYTGIARGVGSSHQRCGLIGAARQPDRTAAVTELAEGNTKVENSGMGRDSQHDQTTPDEVID